MEREARSRQESGGAAAAAAEAAGFSADGEAWRSCVRWARAAGVLLLAELLEPLEPARIYRGGDELHFHERVARQRWAARWRVAQLSSGRLDALNHAASGQLLYPASARVRSSESGRWSAESPKTRTIRAGSRPSGG